MDMDNLIRARDLPPLGALTRMEMPPETGGDCGCGCGNDTGCGCGNDTGCGCGCDNGCKGDKLPCGCGPACGESGWGLNDHPLAMVYSPCQTFCSLYDPETALGRGTLFSELDLPLGGTAASCRYPRY